MKKYHLALILLIGWVCAPARGTTLFTITLDSPVQSGSPGNVLQFFGTITNTTGSTVFLNADNFSLTGFGFGDVTDLFSNTPLSLDGGASSGDLELFDITIPNPFTNSCIAAANCGGTYQILGGADDAAQDVVGTAFFTVPVQSNVPEPSPAVLVSGALLFLLAIKRLFPTVESHLAYAKRARMN